MKINEIIKNVEVIDYTHEAMGIVRVDDQVVFIQGAIVGEILDIKIIEYKKKIYYANIIQIISPSKERVDPFCPHYQECGGCNLQHMSYKEQINLKDKTFKNSLKKGKITLITEKIEECTNKFEYRNKITFSFISKEENLNVGMKKKRTNDIVNIKYCHLISKEMNEIKDEVLKQLRNLKLNTANSQEQGLEQLIVKENNKKEFLIYVKTSYKNINHILKNLQPIDKVVGIYIQDKHGEIKSLVNKLFIQQIDNLSYLVSPKAFFQVNNEQTTKLYEEALKQVKIDDTILLDAYCGSGTIGQYLNKKSKKIVGIEINEDSIKDANYNAQLNKITNYNYIQGDIQKVIEDIYKQNENYFDTVIVDPPRKGIAKNFIEILNKYKPKEIIYISCQPSTLIRDLNLLNDNYNVTFVKQYDMFAQTHHIETLVRLEKK